MTLADRKHQIDLWRSFCICKKTCAARHSCFLNLTIHECSVSVLDCLARDREAAGSILTSGIALCP